LHAVFRVLLTMPVGFVPCERYFLLWDAWNTGADLKWQKIDLLDWLVCSFIGISIFVEKISWENSMKPKNVTLDHCISDMIVYWLLLCIVSKMFNWKHYHLFKCACKNHTKIRHTRFRHE
jgi:hypothetical protein